MDIIDILTKYKYSTEFGWTPEQIDNLTPEEEREYLTIMNSMKVQQSERQLKRALR